MNTTNSSRYGTIILKKRDHALLSKLLEQVPHNPVQRKAYEKLLLEMKTCKVVNDHEIPDDVVQLNSLVVIRGKFVPQKTIHLVAPHLADIAKNHISIVSPMGCALIGYAQNDIVEWTLPAGPDKIHLLEVKNHEVQFS